MGYKGGSGATEPESIGQAVSSGCIRLFNQDIIDLYNRVPVGTHVTVVQGVKLSLHLPLQGRVNHAPHCRRRFAERRGPRVTESLTAKLKSCGKRIAAFKN